MIEIDRRGKLHRLETPLWEWEAAHRTVRVGVSRFADPTIEELEAWDRRHYWHAFTQMSEYEPLVIERAEGCRIIDIRGREYIDGAASMWCNVHGHHHPRIDAAIREQLDRVAHCTSLGLGCDTTVVLAKRLAELAPGGLEHVFFSSDGSSAIEVALKMAFQYWLQCEEARPSKTKFIALSEAYHGDTLGSASVGGIARFHALFRPLLFDVLRGPLPDARQLPEGGAGADGAEFYLRQIEALLEDNQGSVAGVVLEPLVQCAAGMVMHPPGFLRGLRELTRRCNVLLIADEIAVGMGRMGTMFACEQEEVVPDILVLGKGLSGGYLPLSATLTTRQTHDAFLGSFLERRTMYHGHTFSGNPLASAAALASLDLFEEERTLERLQPKIAALGDSLDEIGSHPHVASTRQRGFIGVIELTPSKTTGLPYPASARCAWRVCRKALELGIWIRPLGEALYVMPPLAIPNEELELLMEKVHEAVDLVTAES